MKRLMLIAFVLLIALQSVAVAQEMQDQPSGLFGAVEFFDLRTSPQGGATVGKAAYFGFYYELSSGVNVAMAGSYGEANLNTGSGFNEWQAKGALTVDLYKLNKQWTLFTITEIGESFQDYEGIDLISSFMTGFGFGLRVASQSAFFETASFWLRFVMADQLQAIFFGVAFSVPLLTNR